LDDVSPAFDVFSLGKVLWAMASGRAVLQLWYFDRPDYDLMKAFPADGRMPWVNRLLQKSVREEQKDVWIHAVSCCQRWRG
jgi:hypothetical protein